MTNPLDQLMNIIKVWLVSKKVGAVTINFFKGGVSSVKFEETVKLKDER